MVIKTPIVLKLIMDNKPLLAVGQIIKMTYHEDETSPLVILDIIDDRLVVNSLIDPRFNINTASSNVDIILANDKFEFFIRPIIDMIVKL